MDGKGRAIDNIWIERFLKTIEYNYLTFHPAETGLELYKNVDYYVKYYNNKKHQTTGQNPMSLITLFIPRILLLNTTNIYLAYYHSWSGIGEYYNHSMSFPPKFRKYCLK